MSGKQAPEWLHGNATGVTRAADLLAAGRLVAVPTETVYGLAGRADRDDAVAAIYRAKGRPDFNPLIVHVTDLSMARGLALFDQRAESLARRFWPGPLTMVLPARADSPIVPAVTAGLATIALRMPAHPLMRELLARLDLPLAAPSANRSFGVSPTTPDHVIASLGGRLDAVLDGGACARGLESTIVAPRSDGSWHLLRPGPVTLEELARILGGPALLDDAKIEAPGQLARHYAPGKPLRLSATEAHDGEFLIGFGAIAGQCSLSPSGDLAEAAARLYACLHRAADAPQPHIAVAPVPETGMGAAINDRLRRAAS